MKFKALACYVESQLFKGPEIIDSDLLFTNDRGGALEGIIKAKKVMNRAFGERVKRKKAKKDKDVSHFSIFAQMTPSSREV